LTGDAQMGINWLWLEAMTGSRSWRSPAERVIDQVASTQHLHHRRPEIRGGIAGSFPVDQGYCEKRILNWASKFFADALITRQHGAETFALLG
jgi:hypothetical protein